MLLCLHICMHSIIIITSICILESRNVGYTNLSDITSVLLMHLNDAVVSQLRPVVQQG